MLRIAVVGANGIVGRAILSILTNLQVDVVALGASSVGEVIKVEGRKFVVGCARSFDYNLVEGVLVSAGSVCAQMIKQLAPNAWIIDNSTAFREEDGVSLVVPEIHEGEVSKVVASPNCVAIPLAMVLSALGKHMIKSVWGSTYQSVSGAGKKQVELLEKNEGMYNNVCAQIGKMQANGMTEEEIKIYHEVNKILSINVPIQMLAVRVPVMYGHSMHIRVEMKNTDGVLEKLQACPYIKLYINDIPDPKSIFQCEKVHIGRVRVDGPVVDMWVVSDNIYRGAAWNVCQIAKQYFGLSEG